VKTSPRLSESSMDVRAALWTSVATSTWTCPSSDLPCSHLPLSTESWPFRLLNSEIE
jgi:hypothetical protein